MTSKLSFFDTVFEQIFSDKNQKKVERATLWLSIVGFVINLILIFSKKFELFHTPFEARLLEDPISAIYTPFSIILVYEIYLLIVYLPRSFSTAVSKQFEIISLIIIKQILLCFHPKEAVDSKNLIYTQPLKTVFFSVVLLKEKYMAV